MERIPVSIVLKVDDHASPVLNQAREMLAPGKRRGLMAVIGRKGQEVYRRHFRARDAENRNKQGWPRQHVWASIARATAYDPSQTTDDRAVVVVSSPILSAKVAGAVIRPTNGRRMLAIPMRAEAYGVMPSSGIIPGLRLLGGRGGALYLGKREDGGFRNLVFYYRLVPRVTIPADPRALPPADQVGQALAETAISYVGRALR